MRIGRVEIDGRPRVVVVTENGVRAAAAEVEMNAVIRDRSDRGWLELLDGTTIDESALRWLAPVMPDKLICIGTNFRDHVAEMEAAGGAAVGDLPWPFAFLKPPHTTLVGHEASVVRPRHAATLDWEAELAVVIGDGTRASGPEPLDAVFGYSVLNDLSVRDPLPIPQPLGLDALWYKGFDGSAPMGPTIVTADEIADPDHLDIALRVNGITKQDSNTSQMIFGVRAILAHLGRILTLSPGDVIATGTPAGVGAGRRPPEFLKAGDVVEAEVAGVGVLRTTIID
jgi:2-keto-4-pentenoate hydratase/2-oxohepta-3-ene-1,7-dioic acid hydratase in catechol pathway